MPMISYESFAFWSNYHMTRSFPPMDYRRSRHSDPQAPRIPPLTGVKQLGKVQAADSEGLPMLNRFAGFASMLHGHIAEVLKLIADLGLESGSAAAGLVGKGWSFSNIVGTPVSQLVCEGMTGVEMLREEDCHGESAHMRGRIALVAAGTRVRELVRAVERSGLTVPTSGTHMGPTIAGCIATSSHGSKLGFGGVQDMVRGMHVVTGRGAQVWVERSNQRVLSDQGITRLSSRNPEGDVVPCLRIANDETFEALLVHLGGMGIVTGLAVELTENRRYTRYLRAKKLQAGLLERIDRQDFRGIATEIGRNAEPVFYELTIDPFGGIGSTALHTMYFRDPPKEAPELGIADVVHPSDAVAKLAGLLNEQAFSEFYAPIMMPMHEEGNEPDPVTVMALREFFAGETSAFGFYAKAGKFPEEPHQDPNEPAYTWSELHPHDVITGGIPGALYNASFAIPVDKVSVAVPAICAAVEGLLQTFVFTLRFVENAKGTMAFTRFPSCAVIEIDGISPFICDHKADEIPGDELLQKLIRQALWNIATVVPEGARRVRRALDKARVPFSMHWGKLGELDRAKVQADFGTGGATSAIARWQKARDKLLTPEGKALFWNEALREWGLA